MWKADGGLLPHAAYGEGVSKAVQRMRSRLSGDGKLNRILRKVVLVLNEKG